jgi:hypothetical protein
MSPVLCTYPHSAVNAWNKEALAVLAYELLPLRAEPNARTHGYSLCKRNVSLRERRIGSHRVLGETQEYIDALLCDLP